MPEASASSLGLMPFCSRASMTASPSVTSLLFATIAATSLFLVVVLIA
jgi:hypothetical protein